MRDFEPNMFYLNVAQDLNIVDSDDLGYIAADIENVIEHLQTIVKSLRAKELAHAYDYYTEHRYDIDGVCDELESYYFELDEQVEYAISEEEFEPESE